MSKRALIIWGALLVLWAIGLGAWAGWLLSRGSQ